MLSVVGGIIWFGCTRLNKKNKDHGLIINYISLNYWTHHFLLFHSLGWNGIGEQRLG